ncbi:MAG: glycosyltransferase [Lachnospiraceae bacterium]|nr:glycosyltransferase [Lachnospiraceae bacterium]
MSGENIKVSIITVSYNAAATIEQTICSVVNQTYDNIEYIMIDGKSTDSTCDIIEKYKESIDYYVSEPDNGIYDAMNKGIYHATGDIIGIINSDDWYEEDAVEKAVNCFRNSDAELVYGKIWNICENGTRRCSIKKPLNQLWYSMMIPHPSVFVRKNVYEKYGIFNTEYNIAADHDLILRFLCRGVKFAYIDEIIANFRYGGVSTKKALECAKEAKIIRMKYVDYCPEKEKALVQIENKYRTAEFTAAISENPLALYFVLERKFKDVKDGIVIFGTGVWGERLCQVLLQAGIHVRFFADNDREKWGQELRGIKIEKPQILSYGMANVLIAVRNHDEEISGQLCGYGNDGLNWISIDQMIKEWTYA